MDNRSDSNLKTRTVELCISSSEWELKAQVTVPVGPVRVDELLPIARALADALVDESETLVQQSGHTISCRKGCGACCRQLVAISEIEARRLRLLVDSMPEPKRSQLRARFGAAHRQLDEAGLLRQLKNVEQLTEADYLSLSKTYFEQHIACPFLEAEACSIYPERPITCREYLVTSPAENCSRPSETKIDRVKLPLKVFNAVARWQVKPTDYFFERWVPLIMALQWAESFPNPPPPQPGPDLLRELANNLSGKTPEAGSAAGENSAPPQ